MKTKNWEQIETLFHAAMAMDASERSLYLRQASSEDESLQLEVETLIRAFERSNGLIEQPAFELGMKVLVGQQMDSMVGTLVGAYQILKLLGRGGMGEVYLAEDTRLGRRVALKFLTPEFVGDNWAKRQLIKEAQAVAILDHPNICPVYGIEEHDGHSFIVMQYVEGETLADMIRHHALSGDRVLPLAQQIVGALAEAHAHGIIHRDIKPGNLMVTPAGNVKVLDFGLAKTIHGQTKNETAADSISHLSQGNMVAGTVAYMSPEQLRGERLDYRSDIFSLGTVLYEIVSGENPHQCKSTAETISNILTHQPAPLKDRTPGISRELAAVVHKCLEKDKELRYQEASELLDALNNGQLGVDNGFAWRRLLQVRYVTPLALLLLCLVVGAFVYSKATRVYSIAVLPITNESDSANDYLSDGLTEALTKKLSSLSMLRVKPFTTVSGYKANEIDPQTVGRRLGVDAVIMGKIVGTEGSLNLETTLVSTADGSQLWTSRNPLTQKEILELMDNVSQGVSRGLELWVGKADRTRLARRGTDNPEASRLYMLGRYYWRNRDKKNLEKAIEYFKSAIRLDPLYAQAYAGLADCYVLGNTVAFGEMTTEEAMYRAKAAAKEALRINPDLPEAYTSLGVVSMKNDWDWPASETAFKRALQLDPESAPAHYAYSNLLTILERHNEALAESKAARDLDPFSLSSKMNFCREFYFARDFDKSGSCFQEVLSEDPNNSTAWYVFGFVDLQKGKTDEAIDIFQKLYESDHSLGAAPLGYAYAKAGREPEARKILAAAQQPEKPDKPLPAQEIAIIYLGLGDTEQVFYWLNRACDDHFAPLVYLISDPLLDSLHSDPRFAQLAQRLNLRPVKPNSPPT